MSSLFCPRVVFFGSGSFASPILSSLLELDRSSSCEICLVVTQDKLQSKEGEGAISSGVSSIPLLRAPRFAEELYERLRDIGADLFITASYGFRFPREYLDLAVYGSYNLHASLLPRWRGSSPIQHSLLRGDSRSGVTLIRMDDRIDCGGIIRQASLPIGCDESYKDLEFRLAELGARELEDFLTSGYWQTKPLGIKQDEGGSSYARKLRRDDGLIDWSLSAEFLSCQVRAFSPWPGSAFSAIGKRVLLHAARAEKLSEAIAGGGKGEVRMGEVLCIQPHTVIRCGGARGLVLLSLHRAGGRVCAAADFLRGFPLQAGMILGGRNGEL